MLWKKIIGAAGVLSLALGGLLALAAPAQAVTSADAVSDCDGLKLTVTPNEDHRAWRAVIDGTVVWRSGDFGDDLGNDHQQLVDNGWTVAGEFEVHVKAALATLGTVTLQWWHVNPPEDPNGWTDWAGGAWDWDEPKDCPLEVRPEKPTVVDSTCDDPKGVITIPDTKGVQYRLDGGKVEPGEHAVEPGTHVVKAEPVHPHTFPDRVKKRWKLDVKEPKDCPKERDRKKVDDAKPEDDTKDALPVTGGSPGVAGGAALGLLTLGAGLYLLARNRRIRFTA